MDGMNKGTERDEITRGACLDGGIEGLCESQHLHAADADESRLGVAAMTQPARCPDQHVPLFESLALWDDASKPTRTQNAAPTRNQ